MINSPEEFEQTTAFGFYRLFKELPFEFCEIILTTSVRAITTDIKTVEVDNQRHVIFCFPDTSALDVYETDTGTGFRPIMLVAMNEEVPQWVKDKPEWSADEMRTESIVSNEDIPPGSTIH